MPVYLFTFHAYRSWMPDHPRGYTRRGRGYQPPDDEMAQNYERRAKKNLVLFNPETQRVLIQQFLDACRCLECHAHAGTSETTHIHGLASWKHDGTWELVRASLKSSLTRKLNELRSHASLSRGGSRKHVRTREHFQYLMQQYLPSHSGVSWYEDRGWVNLPTQHVQRELSE